MPLPAGKRLGPYEILAIVGVGGMGEVYRARDTRLDRIVAIKVLPDFASALDFRERLEREARALSTLNHPHICTLHDVGRENGVDFLVMEYLEGETAAQRLAKGPFPLQQALRYAVEIASALDRAHRHGLTHRDVKPGNVMITRSGAKLLDFGLAKLKTAALEDGGREQLTVEADLTGDGAIIGTLPYMSPEQIEGKAVDHRTDIFAFGATVYEMATGHRAFEGRTQAALIGSIMRDEPCPISAYQSVYPPELDGLIGTCLAKDPEERWQSAGDVARQLQAIQSRLSQPHAPVSAEAKAVRNAAGRQWRWSVAALGVAALVAAAALWGIVQRARSDTSRVTRFFITPPASAPLSDFGGIDIVISPDGERIAYFATDHRDQSAILHVRELDELEARDIPGTRVAQSNISNPFMSADGRSVGFYSIGEGVMRTAIDGGPVIEIIDAPAAFFGAAWGNDGSVVFSDAQAMYVVPSSGSGSPTRLTPDVQAADFEGSIYAAPTFLPDGRAVLMTVLRSGGERIAVLDLETREQRILIDGANGFYSPSGHLVFARGTTLFAAPFDPNRRNLTGDPVIVLRGVRHPNLNSAADYALSAEGTLVYVPAPLESSAASELVWVDRTGAIGETAVSEPIELVHDPRLSPNGQRLLVTTGRGGDRDLWIFDLTGRPPVPLARDGDNRLGVWSPDGAHIAFAGIGMSAASVDPAEGVVPRFENIMTIPADGSARTARIVRAAGLNCCPAAWSARGELIVNDAPTSNIVTVLIDDAEEIRDVVATADVEGFAALSPDGQWLAFASDRSGRLEVWVQRYQGGAVSRISRDGGTEPIWSRNGNELFFRQGTAVMVSGLIDRSEGSFGAATMLFDGPFASSSNSLVRTYDVAPDGRFLMARALEANERPPSSIVVVQNWADELERLVP